MTLDKNPKYLMAADSKVSLLYALLVEKYNGDKAAAETKLWETVYAMDQSAKLMGVSVPTVNRCLKSLKDHGTIKKIGNKKTEKWIIVTNELVIDKTDVER